jgi:hypothetical protein
MATISAPNPALFDPDALEQIYAKGTQMPGGMGGLQYLLGYGAKLGRERNSREYLGSLRDTQQLEAIMGSKKIAADLQKSRMDNSRHLAERGYLPSGLTGGADLFTDPSNSDAFAKLLQEEIRSKIFANMNKGAGGGGAGTKDQVTEDRTVPVKDENGNIQWVTIKSRSTDPNTARANADASMRGRQIYTGKGDAFSREIEQRHRENQRNPNIRD